ncbi:MAG: TRAP transporter large permease [Eubacteriales bacterium]
MGYTPILVLFVLFALNIPVAYALLMSAVYYFAVVNTSMPMDMVLQKMVASGESFTLLAVPFFVAVGTVMNYSGIASRLMAMADVIAGHMVGGMGQVNVVLSALMGGVSGSANADAAMQSKLLVPEMVKRGYSKGFSAGITAASACISPVIPPGIGLILYAFLANVSVAKMFMAGYLPGLTITVALMITVHIISKRRKYKPSRERRATASEFFHQVLDSAWALFLPLGIIMGLRVGMFTPTEAGAMSVFYCIFVGIFVYRELKPSMLPAILKESVLSTASVMFIIAAASSFGHYMSWERIPQMISEMMIGITDNRYLMLLIINIFLLFVGMFIEGTAALIILTPLLVPTVTALGVDPVHFGIIIGINLIIGGVTPPFGTLMFLTCSITRIGVREFVAESWPFMVALFVAQMVITFVPPLSLFLPGLIA